MSFPSGTKAELEGVTEDQVIEVENVTAGEITFREFKIQNSETVQIDFEDFQEYELPLFLMAEQGVIDITVSDFESTT